MSMVGEPIRDRQLFVRTSSGPHLQRAEGLVHFGAPVSREEIHAAIVALKADYKSPLKALLAFALYVFATVGSFLFVGGLMAIINALSYLSPSEEDGDVLYWLIPGSALAVGGAIWLLFLIDKANSRLKSSLVWWYDRLFEGGVSSLTEHKTYRYASRRELVWPYAYSDLWREMSALLLVCWGPLLAVLGVVGLIMPAGYGVVFLAALAPSIVITFTCYRRLSQGALEVSRAADPDYRDKRAQKENWASGGRSG